MSLTKEEIDQFSTMAARDTRARLVVSVINSEHLSTLCTLALERLAMEWQPISEAPKEGMDELLVTGIIYLDENGEHWGNGYMSGKPLRVYDISQSDDLDHRRGFRHRNGARWAEHFIPVSALPKVKP